jgi:hypothetical protein
MGTYTLRAEEAFDERKHGTAKTLAIVICVPNRR